MSAVDIKGRWGKFEYGVTGKSQWIARNRDTGEIIARVTTRIEAFRAAERAHDLSRDWGAIERAQGVE